MTLPCLSLLNAYALVSYVSALPYLRYYICAIMPWAFVAETVKRID